MHDNPGLVRALKLPSAFCIIAGSVIGSGVFLVASDIARSVPSTGGALGVWIVAGLFSLVGGLIFAELGTRFPKAGGQYVFLREAFGPRAAFLFSWTQCLILGPGTLAALGVGFARFFSGLYPMDSVRVRLLSSFAILFFTALNLMGVKRGSAALDLLTWIKIGALVALGAGGFIFATDIPLEATAAPVLSETATSLSAYGVALIAAFWAYEGWNGLSHVAGEIDQPSRNIPRASLFGLLAATGLYLWVNASYSQVLATSEIAESTFVAADAALSLWGTPGRVAITILIILSTLGSLNAAILTGARVTYATAEDGAFPRVLARLNRHRVPAPALMLQFALAIVLVWSGTYDQLFTYVICAAFLFYFFCAVAMMKLRAQGGELPPYRVPFYPVLPMIYLLGLAGFLVNAFIERPLEAFIGFGIVLLGLPAYAALKRAA